MIIGSIRLLIMPMKVLTVRGTGRDVCDVCVPLHVLVNAHMLYRHRGLFFNYFF